MGCEGRFVVLNTTSCSCCLLCGISAEFHNSTWLLCFTLTDSVDPINSCSSFSIHFTVTGLHCQSLWKFYQNTSYFVHPFSVNRRLVLIKVTRGAGALELAPGAGMHPGQVASPLQGTDTIETTQKGPSPWIETGTFLLSDNHANHCYHVTLLLCQVV